MRNTLDHSWMISLAYTLQHGEVSGRDFQHTYGVLAQALARLAVALHPADSALYGFFAILLVFRSATIVLFGWLLALIKQVSWKQVFFVFLVFALLHGLFHDAAIRMVLVLLATIFLHRAMSETRAGVWKAWSIVTGGMCLIAQLFTTELGLYVIFSAVITLSAYAIFARFRAILNHNDLQASQHYLAVLGVVVGIWLLGNLGVSFVFTVSAPDYGGFFDYQRYSLELIRGYNNTMGIAWRPPLSFLWGLIMIVLYVVVFVLSSLRRLSVVDGCLLFGFLISSLLTLKGMMLRSDWGHVVMAFIPSIFLFLLVGLAQFQTKYSRSVWITVLLLLFALWPGANFTALTQMWKVLNGELSLRDKLTQIVHYQEPLDAFLPSDFSDALSDAPGAILAFPYQNYIAIGAEQEMIAPALQSFVAHTETLQAMYVQRLSHRNDISVVYGLDTVVSFPIDGVQSISRTPIIFEYLYRNFELQSTRVFDRGYYLLHTRAAPVEFQGHPVAYTVEKSDAANVVVRAVHPTACGLVRLTLTMHYPPMWGIGHPGAVVLRFSLGDVEQKRANVVAIETERAFITYVSLMAEPELYQIFGDGPVSIQQWDTLHIGPYSTGPFGVSPSVVDINAIECIAFDGPSG